MGDVHLSDLLSTNQAPGSGATASTTRPKGERAPLIPDFVTQPKGVYEDDDENVLAEVGNAKLVMRSKKTNKQTNLDQVNSASGSPLTVGSSCS